MFHADHIFTEDDVNVAEAETRESCAFYDELMAELAAEGVLDPAKPTSYNSESDDECVRASNTMFSKLSDDELVSHYSLLSNLFGKEQDIATMKNKNKNKYSSCDEEDNDGKMMEIKEDKCCVDMEHAKGKKIKKNTVNKTKTVVKRGQRFYPYQRHRIRTLCTEAQVEELDALRCNDMEFKKTLHMKGNADLHPEKFDATSLYTSKVCHICHASITSMYTHLMRHIKIYVRKHQYDGYELCVDAQYEIIGLKCFRNNCGRKWNIDNEGITDHKKIMVNIKRAQRLFRIHDKATHKKKEKKKIESKEK